MSQINSWQVCLYQTAVSQQLATCMGYILSDSVTSQHPSMESLFL